MRSTRSGIPPASERFDHAWKESRAPWGRVRARRAGRLQRHVGIQRDRRGQPHDRSTFNLSLADGRNWTQPDTFQINDTGLWKVQFLLFKDGDFSFAYRELHLYVRVT